MKSKMKDLIDSIKNDYLNTSDRIIKTLTGSLEVIQKVFPRYGSFIMELIQNADDAHSKTIRFEVSPRELLIYNDGDPFSEKDIESICDIGQSSKSFEEYIGYFGIGFKSIFMISNSPEIHSKNFSFKFDKGQWPKKSWQILPIWMEKNRILSKDYNIIFRIPLKTQESVMKIRNELEEQLNNRIILFLRNLNKIQIYDKINVNERIIIKSKILSKKYYEIYKIQEKLDNEIIEDNYWLLFRETYDVPEEIRNDELTITWNRQEVKKREIIIAVNLITNQKGYDLISVEKFF